MKNSVCLEPRVDVERLGYDGKTAWKPAILNPEEGAIVFWAREWYSHSWTLGSLIWLYSITWVGRLGYGGTLQKCWNIYSVGVKKYFSKHYIHDFQTSIKWICQRLGISNWTWKSLYFLSYPKAWKQRPINSFHHICPGETVNLVSSYHLEVYPIF